MMHGRSLVVLPTYNERENLAPIVSAILAQAPDLDILVVDDNSPDGTGAIADELAAGTPGGRVLERLDLQSVRSNGYAFQVELNFRCTQLGFRVAEVPIVFVDRRVGKSKMGIHIVTEAMLVVLRLRLQTLLGGKAQSAGAAPAKYSRTP